MKNINTSIINVARQHWKSLIITGIFILLLLTTRKSRSLILTTQAINIGLPDDQVGYIISITMAFETSVFFLSGIIMDRFGRKYTAVPAPIILGSSLILILVADTFWILSVTGAIGGIANGLTSGLVLTLGADLAPNNKNRGPFLGLFRMFSDLGAALGPMFVGVITNTFDSLDIAALVFASIGISCGMWMCLCVPETLRKDTGKVIYSSIQKKEINKSKEIEFNSQSTQIS